MLEPSSRQKAAFIATATLALQLWFRPAGASDFSYRWVYRNPQSIINPNARDMGEGSFNGTVARSEYRSHTTNPVLQYSHGATTAFLPNGSLAVIWQGSPLWWEGNMEQATYWALSDDDGNTFGPATRLYALPSGPLWGPSIHVENGTLYMFISGTAPKGCLYQGEGGPAYPPGGDLQMMSSSTNGASWSAPKTLISAAANGTSGKLNIGRLVVDNQGSWLLPFWRERSGPSCWQPSGASLDGVPGVLTSTDKGKTWTVSSDTLRAAPNTPPTQWLIENIIVRYSNASRNSSGFLQTFRSNTSSIWQSWSLDDGKHWTEPVPGPLTAPNSKTDLTELPDGSILVAFNNNTHLRTALTLARSTDGGLTWTHLDTIETNVSAAYSYPTVTYHPAIARVSVVYSVWQPPCNASSAYAQAPQKTQTSEAPAPTRAASPQSGGLVASTQHLETAGRRLREMHTGRKLLDGFPTAEPQQMPGRRLAQMPFNIGAWGKVSYGIRIAFIDLETLLQDQLPQLGGR